MVGGLEDYGSSRYTAKRRQITIAATIPIDEAITSNPIGTSRVNWKTIVAHRTDLPVKIIFMANRNTLQADTLKLVVKKLQSSLAVVGEPLEDGLAA